jgi:hypothetical protein
MKMDAVLFPGSRTTSIEVNLLVDYDVKLLAAVLQTTPNLLTFVFSIKSDQDHIDQIPEALINAIITHLPRLEHLYIDMISNSPTFEDVISLLKELKHIYTLHLQNIFLYPSLATFMNTPQTAAWTTTLGTLSLGVLNHSSSDRQGDVRPAWDKLVTMLTHGDISMPSLQELVIPMFPSNPIFFSTYGPQIKTLHTTSFFSQEVLAPALGHCP